MSARASDAKPLPLIQPNAQNQYDVGDDDLPLSCPMPQMQLWNSHPRVYLPIEATGWAKCPYCGAEYTLRRCGRAGRRAAWRAMHGAAWRAALPRSLRYCCCRLRPLAPPTPTLRRWCAARPTETSISSTCTACCRT